MKYFLTAIFITAIVCGIAISYEWHHYILNSGLHYGGYIDIDTEDRPHILYYQNFGYDKLIYTYYDEYEWIEEYVDDWYGDCSMVLDDQDNPHISLRDWVNKDLMYCYKDGDEWVVELVDDEEDSGAYNDIVLDSNGYPHISYAHSYVYLEDKDLRYAYFDGSEWHKEVVDDEYERQGYRTSIALDSSDYPHITYEKDDDYSNNEYLSYAHWNGDEWILENIDYVDDRIYSSIVIDSQDIPHVAYFNYDNYDLMYAYREDGEWHKEVVDDECYGDVSIALDSNEYPCIAYCSMDENWFLTIRYAHWNGSSWDIDITVDTGGNCDLGQYLVEMALDSEDRPHIACDEWHDFGAWYIWYGDPLNDITLLSFTAEPSGASAVNLRWSISTDEGDNISGFNLYRRELQEGAIHKLRIQHIHEGDDTYHRTDADIQWHKVNSTIITGTNPYSYTDTGVAENTQYEYKLEAVMGGDSGETLGTTTVETGNPESFEVTLYPNPSSGIFIMKYNGDISGIGEINIYDISGRLVDVVEILGNDNRASDTKAGLYEGELMLDLTTLSDGLYIVNIGDNLQKRVLICR
ncbi:MAG TPA: T9SS type A sorting domain-containing protein [Firmicutes bacterium]|nr:T9SS type A sorting domain-containing protein [Bacillota bacterium]